LEYIYHNQGAKRQPFYLAILFGSPITQPPTPSYRINYTIHLTIIYGYLRKTKPAIYRLQ